MRDIIVLNQTFAEPSFSVLAEALPHMGDYNFQFFKNAALTAQIAGVKANYDRLISLITSSGARYEELDAGSVDEYMLRNWMKSEIYTTPTTMKNALVSSAAILGFKGGINIFTRFHRELREPVFQNAAPLVKVFLTSKSFGIKGLSQKTVQADHSEGTMCFFNIGGRRMSQPVMCPDAVNQGREGFTMLCRDDVRYRVKILERDFMEFELEKLRQMIGSPYEMGETAKPLAFVYNSSEQIIGTVMKNFTGRELSLDTLHEDPKALLYVRDVLEQVIQMEVMGYLHKDLSHNFICDTTTGRAHVIDIDSTQYWEYPATAETADKCNGLPHRYENSRVFYNTVDLSYTLILICAAAVVNPDELLGMWGENGLIELRDDVLSRIEQRAKPIYDIIVEAHRNAVPVSFIAQLEAVENTIKLTGAAGAAYRTPFTQRSSDAPDNMNGRHSYGAADRVYSGRRYDEEGRPVDGDGEAYGAARQDGNDNVDMKQGYDMMPEHGGTSENAAPRRVFSESDRIYSGRSDDDMDRDGGEDGDPDGDGDWEDGWDGGQDDEDDEEDEYDGEEYGDYGDGGEDGGYDGGNEGKTSFFRSIVIFLCLRRYGLDSSMTDEEKWYLIKREKLWKKPVQSAIMIAVAILLIILAVVVVSGGQ